MSLLEENSEVKMDCENDLARSPPEPGLSVPSMSCAHSGAQVNARAPEQFSIEDQDHKVLILHHENLLAVPNKKGVHAEIFFVLATHLSSSSEEKGSPILLAVSKGERCLCCKRKGQRKPTLVLKKKKLTKLATQSEKARHAFIFYKAKVGSRYTLESAAHPGWFVCTSNSHECVDMTKEFGKRKYTEFDFIKFEVSSSEVSD
ncbi:interleukin-37 [Nycticebus coucang]|uniref:interleukin-37 n=1 Tax=Nycticebus coucang TaxID=9470 RepID=UPI00234D21DE|nr:interleukin-37 [Nycticebus coucang]